MTAVSAQGSVPPPEVGQLVTVRGRLFIAQDVIGGGEGFQHHQVELESLEDDSFGQRLTVLWEHEVHPVVVNALGWPQPTSWDPPERIRAFTNAVRWSTSSVLSSLPLQAPFRGAIEIEDYQLDPVVRALQMPRVNLLIADDVGLGKTIEAGLVVQELLARQRARRVLILCPASLQSQWQEEMREKFALDFRIVNREYINNLRREYGVHANPWASYPRLIASIDFLKREHHLEAFQQSLQNRDGSQSDWDLLILDEAHNVSPSGKGKYVRDSDRTQMLRHIIGHIEHRLFLTATPHNGYTESFTALLELLDPLRFSRGPEVNREQLRQVMVRRMKDDITDALGRRRFPVRVTEPPISVHLPKSEAALFDDLNRYIEMRMTHVEDQDALAVRFALTLLKKRLLSSPRAFRNSLAVHMENLGVGERNADVVRAAAQRADDDYGDDNEKDESEQVALGEASAFFQKEPDALKLLSALQGGAGAVADTRDAKASALLAWIEERLKTDGKWNQERLLVFTEYKDTLEHLHEMLVADGHEKHVQLLYGGMTHGERARIKEAFLKPVDDETNPVRILLATDAASEGLNLQAHCRYLIHYEIPWNPVRMEQRNGRIDRHGQPAEKVWCLHFHYENNRDSDMLRLAVQKVTQMRQDLGSVGDVIAKSIEENMLGRRGPIAVNEQARAKVREELRADLLTQERIHKLQQDLSTAREAWDIHPDTVRAVVEDALQLLNPPGELTPSDDGNYRLKGVPEAWRDVRPTLVDGQNRLKPLTFDHGKARDLKGATLVHLDHPLMRRALALYRGNLWSAGLHDSHQLARATYHVVPDRDLSRPAIIGLARLVVLGRSGNKLHEEILPLGGEFHAGEVYPVERDGLERMLEYERAFPPIPRALAQRLHQLFPAHRAVLDKLLERQRKERQRAVKKDLKARADTEAKIVKQLVGERRKEIEQRLKDLDKYYDSMQGTLFPQEQIEQTKSDLSWLRFRLEELIQAQQEGTEEHKVREKYEVRDAHLFPMALIYLLPESLVEGVEK